MRALTSSLVLAGLLIGLAACSHRPPQWAKPAPTLAPVAAAKVAPQPEKPDLCGAKGLAGLIGRSRTEIPIPADLSMRHVVCTTCVAPEAQLDRRQLIWFDAETGLVTAVGCG